MELEKFLRFHLLKSYALHLKEAIDELQLVLCYGCQQGESDRFTHNVCQMSSVRSKVEFCFVCALERLDHDKVMECYAEKMGLAALEWIEAYDYEYKTQVWMKSEEWKTKVINLIVSQYLSH